MPKTIGQFTVVRIIGSGGMGVVYEARQEQPSRTVAIKVLRQGLASHSALRRFEHESEVMAHLRHPGIAHVYASGIWEDGAVRLPYFAMEHIPGARPITTYAHESQLSTRDRVKLFASACDAVHHGHQRGIIHRDIKPANLLVDEDGAVKVIDFGVARATDADVAITTMQTDIGQLIGTLQYMSPEQCDGNPHEIGVRSDVYSLGMVLYELLCDRPPYDVGGTTLARAARTVQETAPPRPSTVSRSLRGGLETIVLKALEKDPGKRYDSAGALGRDLGHWLNREPIEARPPTRWSRAVRWAATHPFMTTAAMCLLIAVTILAGTLLSVQFALQHPHRIEMTDDHREVRLLSPAGSPIHIWRPGGDEEIKDALMMRAATDEGERTLVLLGYGTASVSKNPGALFAYDIDRSLDEPYWTRQILLEETPPSFQRSGLNADGFNVQKVQTANVFPTEPGDEIIAVWAHVPTASACLRIYSGDGRLLYQLWRFGPWQSVHWLAGPRRLVMIALNSRTKWKDFGIEHEQQGKDPDVMFAVTPVLGEIADDWCTLEAGDGPFVPHWHLWFPPLVTDACNALSLVPPNPGEADPSRFFRVNYQFVKGKRSMTWLFDENGQVFPGSGVANNAYDEFEDPHEPEDYLPGPLEAILERHPGGERTDADD
jgi:tRNA A-37 threonylcarbamoyl transferase component Bud32